MNLKKIIALALVVCMVLSFFPASVFAEEWDEEIVLTDEEYYEEPQEEYVEEIVEEEPADYVEYVEPVEEIVVEEPVEEPVVEEPAAEEPAAEEPAAEEPAAPAAAADLEAAETFGATTVADKYNADWSEAVDSYATLQAAFNAGGNIELTKDVTEDVVVSGTVNFRALAGKKLTGNITVNSGANLTMSGDVTVENPTGVAITMNGGTLSIPEGDTGNYGVVVGQGTLPGKVKGGIFASISGGLIAPGYKLDGGKVIADGSLKPFYVTNGTGNTGYDDFSGATGAISAYASDPTATMITVYAAAGTTCEIDKAGTFNIDKGEAKITAAESYYIDEAQSSGNTYVTLRYGAKIEDKDKNAVAWKATFADAVEYMCGTPAATAYQICIIKTSPALTTETKGTITNSTEGFVLRVREISGADHNVKPNETLVSGVEGYMVADVSETGATIKSYKLMPCVAKIGEVLYPSVREAVAAANDGDTITMVADDNVSFSAANLMLEINGTKAITIDGDGHTIVGQATPTDDVHAILIKGSGNVTFQNVKLKNFGDSQDCRYTTYPIYAHSSYTGKLTLSNVTISDFTRTAVVVAGGTFAIDGCTITGKATGTNVFQSGIEVWGTATGTITNTTISGMGSTMTREDSKIAGCVQLGHPLTGSIGKVTLGTGNNFSGQDYVISTGIDGDTSELDITDGEYSGDIIKETNGKIAVFGGTFTKPVPEDCCAAGYIPTKNESGTYGVKEGTIAMRIVKLGGDDKGPGYDAKDVATAVTDAIAAYETDKTLALCVFTGTYSDVEIPNDSTMQIYCKEGVSFSVKSADVAHYVEIKTVKAPVKVVDTIATKTSYTLESKLYQATVTEEGKEPVPFANIYDAIESAIETGGVLKPLVKYNETTNYNYGIGIGEILNVDQSGDIKLDIVKRDGVLCVINTSGEGTTKATYECVAAVASYVDDGETVYTTTFAEAAEKAAALAQTTNYAVTLYAKPDITGENPDVYTMGSGTLKVTATPTDLADYDKLVVTDGEKVLTATINEARTVATYTVEAAVAKIELNGSDPLYFSDFVEAAWFIAKDAKYQNLVVTPLVAIDASFASSWANPAYKFNVKNTDLDVDLKAPDGYAFKTTKGDGFTTYVMVEAIASVALPGEPDEYFNPTTVTKYYATVQEAVEAAGTNPITMLRTATLDEQYEMKVQVPPQAIKFAAQNLDPVPVKAPDGKKIHTDTATTGYVTYTLENVVAVINNAGGTYTFASFADAVNAASNTDTIELKDNIADPYELADGTFLNVKLDGYSVTINPKNDSAEKYAIKVDDPDAQGVTKFTSVLAVASVEAGDAVTYFADFEDAVTVAAGTHVITIYQNIDKYELGKTIPDEILIVNKNEKTINVVSGTDKAVKETTDETTGVTTYTLVTAVASITTGTETKYYETFEEAAAAGLHVSATSAPTIVLLDDITTEYKFTSESHVLVINLNGHTLNTIGVDIATTEKVGYVVKETAIETATIYSVAKAEARIGGETDGTYYETLAEAAVAAAGTETVVLLNNTPATSATYTYQLTATINKVIVDKNEQTLTVTSGVTGKAVSTTQSTVGGKVLFTYELSDPTAMVERTGGNAYYDTFKEAVDDGNYAPNGTEAPVIHLLKSDTTEFGLTNGYNINVELNGNEVNVVGVNNSGETKKLVIIETEDGDITNYSCVEAVARITNGTEETYYATVGGEDGAFAAAFVPADGGSSLVVELLKAPPATDKFVGSLGYFDVDVGTTGAIIVRDNLTLENGLTATPTLISGTTYRVTIDNSPVYIVKNNLEKQYFDSIDAAKPDSNAAHPIVLDAANLSYALAKDDTLYINKNGHDDFVVTKVDPELNYRPDANIQYSILEETVGDVTTYTTGAGVAYIDDSHEEPDGDYGTKTVHNYVFYDTFDDAVEAAAGVKTIVVNAERGGYAAGEIYTLDADETLIVDLQFVPSFIEDVVRAPESGILNDEVDGTVHTLTVGEAVATVTVAGVETVFDDLEEAIDFAIEKLPNNGVLKLLAEVPEDFTYEFGNLDKLLVSDLAGDYKFADGVLTAPEGKYVKGTGTLDPADCKLYEVKDLLATVEYEDGDEIVTEYFDTFAPAVDLVQSIEIAKPYNDATKDPVNPTTPITLWMDNVAGFQFADPAIDTDAVQSLMIETNGFDTNLTASLDGNHFIEAVAATFGGPVQFKNSLKVAQIDNKLAWETVPNYTYYSSFSAAATDAMENDSLVEIVVTDRTLVDVFEMNNGTLKVKGSATVDPDSFITEKKVIPVGDMAVLSYKADEGVEYQGTFTVSGSEAMIVYQDQTTAPRYFKTFLDAVIAQNGNEYLPIIPLTDISKTYTATDLTPTPAGSAMINKIYVDSSAKYDVDVKVVGYEVVKDETYTDSDKYDIEEAVCYVETDKTVGYNPDNSPIHEKVYFSDIGRASKFAMNTRIITMTAPVTSYVLGTNGLDEVLNLNENTASVGGLSSVDTQYGVKQITPAPEGATSAWKLAGLVTVTVDPGDGAFASGAQVTFTGVPGSPIDWTGYTAPTLEGYSLDYYEGSDGKNYATTASTGMELMPTAIPENDLTMTAKYNANQYWVVYSDGTNPDKYVKATFGQLITPPEDPAVPAHNTFDGWYYVDEKFDFATTTFNKSLITNVNSPATGDTYHTGEGLMLLTAKYIPDEYTVTFDTKTTVTVDPVKATYPEGIDKPSTITGTWTREGYDDFVTDTGAWTYVDEEGNTGAFTFGRSTGTTVPGNITVSPDWQAKTMELTWANESTILATSNPVDVGSPLEPLTEYGTPAKKVVDLQKEGYRLDPDNLWVDLPDTVPYDESGTWIFQLNWIEQIPVSFTYEGELLDTINVDKNSTLADNDKVPSPGVGKIYTWTLKGEPYDLNTPVTEKMTLVGTIEDKPVEDTFEVTFSTDHGDTPETQIVKSGETAVKPADPTEEGWAFVGWFKGETEFDFDTPITEDTELVAKWNEDDTARFGVSLELEGVLQMNALVRNVLHEDQLENYLVTAVFDGEESASMTLDQAEQRTTSSGLRYVVPVAFVPAKNMIDKVHVVLSYVADPDHPVVIQEQDVSVQDYCDGLISQTSNAKLIEMLKATLDYGAFAQRQLNYKTATLANATYPDRDAVVRATTVSDSYKIESITGNCTGLGDTVGKSLNMVASTELWIMFKPENVSTIGSYTFTIDGVEVEAEAQNNRFVVKLAGAPSNELDVKHTFVATNKDDGSSMTVEYSTMAFCYEAQSTSQFGDLSKAVARYHIAAKAYFG